MPFSTRPDGPRLWWVLPLLLLAACAQQSGYGSRGRVEIGADGWKWASPRRYYPPPGSPEDPWGPYIREAAGRYRVPEQWVRAVMQQESGGEQQATSPVGAMGLMQVMPATYDELRVRHGLGDDPYEPHNNILAGTAYIREMYDRFGAPGFLAAYNAGPDRLDGFLAGRSNLPDETVNYVAAITPNLGNTVPLSGPLMRIASARSGRGTRFSPTVASLAAGCDLNAAYNPSRPCSSLQRAATQPAAAEPAFAQPLGVGGCDVNAAYNPNHPCRAVAVAEAAPSPPPTREPIAPPAPVGVQLASISSCDAKAAFNPARPCHGASIDPASSAKFRSVAATVARSAPIPPHRPSYPAEPAGGWAIQVGAFKTPSLARAVAEGARARAPHQLRTAALALQPTAPFGGSVLYRARLVHLSESAASSACTHLNRRQLPCVVVPPSRS